MKFNGTHSELSTAASTQFDPENQAPLGLSPHVWGFRGRTPALLPIQKVKMRIAGPLMQARQKGSILNVGSPVGIVGARKPQYAASKAALHGLTMSAARALGSDGIRVNLLLPGPTITGMTADWSEEQRERVAQGTFLKRMCQPEEIGEMVAFLVSDNSRYLTASVIDMTAGSMMGH